MTSPKPDTRQLALYDLYNGTPPHEKSSRTSRDAAESMREHARPLREVVFEVVQLSGHRGMTSDEVEERLGGRHQTISARMRELALAGRIVNDGTKRPTRSGRNALVWRATFRIDSKEEHNE